MDKITLTTLNGIALVQAPQSLGKLQASSFQNMVAEIYAQSSRPPRIVLDLSDTTFMDSMGLGVIVSLMKVARQYESELVLWSVSGQVEEVITLAGLNQVLKIDPDTWAIHPEETLVHRSLEDSFTTHPSIRSPVKRAVDIAGALVGLAITGVLLPFIALAIYLDNPGPIFFSQIRCGWLGRRFRLWKFRSMVVNAEARKAEVKNEIAGAFFKNKNDPRVTRVGRFLRKTSLDEFPQFWNVLKGDMSLVGTRPPTPDEIDQYHVPAWSRLDVKPGITGEWQVRARSSITDFEDVIRLDLEYQRKWSLRYDLQLIWETAARLLLKKTSAF